jgi:hypothetical protein
MVGRLLGTGTEQMPKLAFNDQVDFMGAYVNFSTTALTHKGFPNMPTDCSNSWPTLR